MSNKAQQQLGQLSRIEHFLNMATEQLHNMQGATRLGYELTQGAYIELETILASARSINEDARQEADK